ncbi:MAG: hypothetical protein E7039_00325 [Lentisphaerae bacterium]|nr:hypothetical protein [Lentisphaerota bacterium]
MKFSKYYLLTVVLAALASAGCSTTADGKSGEPKVKISEIPSIQLGAVVAQGRTLGEKLLQAYQTNDYKLAESLNIGDDKNKFSQARFDRLVKVFNQFGGIKQYSYMGDMNMKPTRRLFWKVSFNGSEKVPAAADKDMLFEVRIAVLNGNCRIVGFGLLPY